MLLPGLYGVEELRKAIAQASEKRRDAIAGAS
jgi:hypothetical protein